MKDSERVQTINEQNGIRNQFVRYFRYKWLFIASLVSCILLCYIYMKWKTPQYGIYAKIVIKDEKKGESIDFPFRDIDVFDDRNTVENEIEIIQSKTTIETVVKKLDLTKNYFWRQQPYLFVPINYSNPVRITVLREPEQLYETPIDIKLIDSSKYELENTKKTYRYGEIVNSPFGDFIILKTLKFSTTDYTRIRIQIVSIPESTQNIGGNLSISQTNRNASMLNLRLLDAVPERGIDILNAIINEYNQSNLRYRDSQTTITSNIIHDRLNLIAKQLTGIENSEQKYKSAMGITDLSADAQLFLDKAKESDRQITDTRIKMEILKSIEAYAIDASSMTTPPTSGLNDVVLQGLVTSLSQLQLERSELLKTLGPENTRVKVKTTQIDDVRSSILSNIGTQRRNIQSTLTELLAEKSRIDGEIRSVPFNERNLTKIIREKSIQENIYHYLLQKREEVNIASASEYSKMRIIDSAYSSARPVKPKKLIVYFTGLLIAIVLPIVYVNFRESVNRRIIDSAEIFRAGLPVIAEITVTPKTSSFLQNGYSFQSEQFRMLITKLKSEIPQCKTILVTSSEPSEGKSYISTHLAEVFTIWGKKTLLIDADLRKGKVSKALELDPTKYGLADFLLSKSLIPQDIISNMQVNNHNVDVIASGHEPSAVFKLHSSDRLPELFAYATAHYDQIIINTPPVKLVSDALSFASYADATLYVVRHRFTLKSHLKYISELNKKEILGTMFIVVNYAELETRKNSRFREYFRPIKVEA
jgi:tyrosine-protein kinase Etk/Wzc